MRGQPVPEMHVCACGVAYLFRTYRYGQTVFHYECPPCETSSQRIAIEVARVLDGTEIGRIIARIAR